jgi:hypothetical protein
MVPIIENRIGDTSQYLQTGDTVYKKKRQKNTNLTSHLRYPCYDTHTQIFWHLYLKVFVPCVILVRGNTNFYITYQLFDNTTPLTVFKTTWHI